MAVVEDIEKSNFLRALKLGILRRMITTALPISKDFKVVLEGETLPARQVAKADIEREVDILNKEFRKKLETDLREYWKTELKKDKLEDVPPEYYKIKDVKMPSPGDVKKQVSAIEVPQLGLVAGHAILAKQTLTTEKLDERGYVNHGFAIYANGKLVNPEDELFGVSHGAHASGDDS
jgi:hypothetical protein